MTEKYAEKISMLMDDELRNPEAGNLIDGINHDEWLKQCWERYHLISDALKNNLPSLVKHDLGKRLSAALEAEKLTASTPTNRITMSPTSSPSWGWRWPRRWRWWHSCWRRGRVQPWPRPCCRSRLR